MSIEAKIKDSCKKINVKFTTEASSYCVIRGNHAISLNVPGIINKTIDNDIEIKEIIESIEPYEIIIKKYPFLCEFKTVVRKKDINIEFEKEECREIVIKNTEKIKTNIKLFNQFIKKGYLALRTKKNTIDVMTQNGTLEIIDLDFIKELIETESNYKSIKKFTESIIKNYPLYNSLIKKQISKIYTTLTKVGRKKLLLAINHYFYIDIIGYDNNFYFLEENQKKYLSKEKEFLLFRIESKQELESFIKNEIIPEITNKHLINFSKISIKERENKIKELNKAYEGEIFSINKDNFLDVNIQNKTTLNKRLSIQQIGRAHV